MFEECVMHAVAALDMLYQAQAKAARMTNNLSQEINGKMPLWLVLKLTLSFSFLLKCIR